MADQLNDERAYMPDETERHHENPEQRFMRQVVERLDELVLIGQNSLVTLNGILKAVTPVTQVFLSMYFRDPQTGVAKMALQLPIGQTDDFFINALDAQGNPTALANGQTVTVVSADPSVVLAADAAARIDPKTNIQSVLSGKVSLGPNPVIGSPVVCTATLLAADGVTPVDTETDTVAALAAGAVKLGIFFEDASVNPSPAGGARRK